jgi:virulence factor Mce-like protein
VSGRRFTGADAANLRIGVLACLLILVGVYLAATKELPWQRSFELKAAFRTTKAIQLNSPVRIAGVEVGKVTKLEGQPGKGALVTMEIEDEGLPIHRDAQLKIRPRLFLEGNYFVDVTPGTPAAPALSSGDVVPVNQTAAPVQVHEVLTALQSDTREDLRTTFRELGKGLDGRGGDGFNRSIRYWRGAFRGAALTNQALLGTEEHDLSTWVGAQSKVAAALAADEDALKGLVTNFNTTMGTLAAHDESLQATLTELPPTLERAVPALRSLDRALPSVSAFARDILPGVRSSDETLDATLPLMLQLRKLFSENELLGLLRDLEAGMPDLAAFNRSTTDMLEQLRPLANCTNNVLVPFSKETVPDPEFPTEHADGSKAPIREELVLWLTGPSGETRSGDANGQWFRTQAGGGSNVVAFGPAGFFGTTLAPISASRPGQLGELPEFNPQAPCENQELPDLDAEQGAAPAQNSSGGAPADSGVDAGAKPDPAEYRRLTEMGRMAAYAKALQGGLELNDSQLGQLRSYLEQHPGLVRKLDPRANVEGKR